MANHESKPNPMVFFELSVGGEKREGRIEMELFADKTPKTAENFRALCTGEKGVGDVCGYPLHYKGTSIHSISPDLMWCGGDITHGNADGESIYGAVFEDENFIVKHSCPGILSMANASENTNRSQFMILTRAFDVLDDEHVAFGRVVKGLDLMRTIEEEVATDEEDATDEESGRTSKPVVIVNCGMIPPESTEGASSNA